MHMNLCRVFCNVRHTLVVRDMIVSCKVHGRTVNQGGTADKDYLFALDRITFSVEFFCLIKLLVQKTRSFFV